MLFKMPDLDATEMAVIEKVERLKESLRYALGDQPRRWSGLLRRTAFARALRGSNTIEGYNVTVDDAIAAAEGEEPMEADAASWTAVQGYRDAMTYVLQLASDPHFSYSADLLRGLHYMMLKYDLGKNPGRWRPGPIYVFDDMRREVVYDGPDAEMVAALINVLVQELNSKNAVPPLVQAAMGHLNLVMIHPFSDGNGRMARCLQTLILARTGILAPPFASIEEYLGRNTRAYYDVLAKVGQGRWNPERDTRPWVRFCLTAHFRQATTLLRRSREVEKLWGLLDAEITQRGLPERLIFALVEAALGLRVRNATYRHPAEVSDQLASRDLRLAVDAGLLMPYGERRGRYYLAAPRLREIRVKVQEPKNVVDPFAAPSPDNLELPL